MSDKNQHRPTGEIVDAINICIITKRSYHAKHYFIFIKRTHPLPPLISEERTEGCCLILLNQCLVNRKKHRF